MTLLASEEKAGEAMVLSSKTAAGRKIKFMPDIKVRSLFGVYLHIYSAD